MATIFIKNNSTVSNFAGGVDQVNDQNQVTRISFGGSWNVGDSFQFDIVTSATLYSAGSGRITEQVPMSVLTLYNKVNFLSDTSWFFSDNGDPTAFEQQAPGAGFIELSNQFSMPEELIALTQYQGMMCVQSRRTSQIWVIDPNPANYALFQTLANIGCFSPLGSGALGDLDVIFPYDSGIRSLRARDVTLNATPTDIGSAIDEFVEEDLLPLSESQLQQCCSIIEPSQNRFWLFIPNSAGTDGIIYVLSYFPTNKIVAWSRYNPTYSTFTTKAPDNTFASDVTWTTLTIGSTYRWTPGVNETFFTINGVNYTEGFYFTAANTQAEAAFANGSYTGKLELIGNPIAFIPQKFVVFQGQVYISTATGIYIFGGADNNTYDAVTATLQLPYYDEKRPGHQKISTNADCDVVGNWDFKGTPDWIGGNFNDIVTTDQATFDNGNIPFQDKGSHFSFQLTSVSAGYAKVSSLLLYYQLGEEPAS